MHQNRPRMSIKLRWLAWRARLSVPSMLANEDESRIVSRLAAANGSLAVLIISLLAWLTDLPLVFPALGPTAFILFSKPFSADAAPRSVILGHFTGITCGTVVWHVAGAICHKPVSLEHAGWPVFCTAAAALAITCFLLVRFACPHAPACATALVIALGGVTRWTELLAMAVAVAILTAQAVLIHRLAGVNVPRWSSGRPDARQV